MENILNRNLTKRNRVAVIAHDEENPLAEFLELCIQSGLQFENSERANLLDKAIDFSIEKGLI
jgi:hypothetical protein|tara:strand:- start:97 stop:285 length:189 start_codon:yes stop_codon:yes gene_type:complete